MPDNNGYPGSTGRAQFPLDAEVLHRLDNLALLTRRSMASGRPGRRRSPLPGSSMEFADFRRYTPGDDFRRIDWRAYARLERLFLRVFEAEENITVTLLIDCSDSMYQGRPPKANLAIELAAALAYVALKCEDNVILGALTDRLAASRRVGSSKHSIWTVGEFLERLPRSGATNLNKALYDLGRVLSSSGLTIVISDFLAPNGYKTGVRAVRQLRQEVALLQILSPDEIEPDIQGDWRLRDSEGAGNVEVSASPNVLQAYKQRLALFTQELASTAHDNAGTYSMISSDTKIIDVVQRLLRQIELVRKDISMSLLVPAALAFSVIIPLILVLYFMRPKRQERVIGSTLLWQQALQDLQASRPWQRLRITPLLLLQLLAAVVIVLVLSRPALLIRSPLTGDTIIILQASASMQATDVAPNRFEAARNQIADFIDTLGPNDHLSLITMARTPQVLIASSQDKDQLKTALQRAKVTNQDADLEQALSLALSLAAGRTNFQVLVIGDGHVLNADQTMVLPFPVHYLSIGTDAPNAALLALASRTLQGNLVALAQVANYSHQQRSIPIELYADGHLISVQTISLPAEASGAVQWGPLPPTTRVLHARVVTQDAMTADHEAWAIIGSSVHGRVLLVTKGNTFLEAALKLQPNIDLFETTPDKYVNTSGYDLTIFDGFVPPSLPDGGLFFVNPPAGSYLFGKVGPEIQVSHINAGNDSANLLSTVDLSSIHVLRSSHQLEPALWAQSIIAAPETPLLIAGENNNRRIAALGFDLHDTDLPLQPAFPILMHNMVNWFLPPPVGGDGQVAPGTPVSVQTWPGAEKITITPPNQQTVTVGPPFPVVPFNKTDQVGLYQVTQRVHGVDRQGAFTVNLFDSLQSQLAPARGLPVVHSTDFTEGLNLVPRELREVWPWIAALLLLVLCLEWWLFSRGYKQQHVAAVQREGTALPRGGRLPSRTPPSRLAAIQDQLVSRFHLETQYRTTMKRLTKATKRARSRLAGRQ